jgi:hypothetical protein
MGICGATRLDSGLEFEPLADIFGQPIDRPPK